MAEISAIGFASTICALFGEIGLALRIAQSVNARRDSVDNSRTIRQELMRLSTAVKSLSVVANSLENFESVPTNIIHALQSLTDSA